MAVTDTGTLTELVNSEFINPAIMEYAHDFAVSAPYVNWQDLRGKSTKVGSFPRWVLDTATKPANETTTLANETLETVETLVTAAEVGIRRDVSKASVEESILGAQIWDFLIEDAGTLLGISLDDDIAALFPSFSTQVGATTVNLSLANMVEAQAQIRKNKMRGSLVNILDDQQASDYQAAQAASTSTVINSFMTVSTGIDNGYLSEFMGAPVWQTGLCDTANTGADVVGACFIRGDQNKKTAAIGGVLTRDIESETQRVIEDRLTKFVATGKWGVGETADESGCGILSDS